MVEEGLLAQMEGRIDTYSKMLVDGYGFDCAGLRLSKQMMTRECVIPFVWENDNVRMGVLSGA